MGDSDVADAAKLTEIREMTPSNALSFARRAFGLNLARITKASGSGSS